jgi:protein-S-isoprenylcysteine O-methyltransferase Ste14
LTSANWAIGVPQVAALAILVMARVEKEEALMMELFSDAYRDYMARTGRFLPRRRT